MPPSKIFKDNISKILFNNPATRSIIPVINPITLFEKGASMINLDISINKVGRLCTTASSTVASTFSNKKSPRA